LAISAVSIRKSFFDTKNGYGVANCNVVPKTVSQCRLKCRD